MKKEAEYFLALKEFSKDVGAPDVLVCDSAKTQKKREVKDFCTQIGTTLNILEAETQWANRSELWVGLVNPPARIFETPALRLCYGIIVWNAEF